MCYIWLYLHFEHRIQELEKFFQTNFFLKDAPQIISISCKSMSIG